MSVAAERLCGWCMERDTSLLRSHVEGQAFTISDMLLPDCPIIFASQAFIELTGFSREEIIGHNCRFLQGPETDKASVRRIRQAVEAEESLTLTLLNYKRDKSTFWNQLQLVPVKDSTGRAVQYVGAQLDVMASGIQPLDSMVQTPASASLSLADVGPMASIASLLSCEAEDLSMMSVPSASSSDMNINYTLSNPHLPDNPMTHVSDGFLKLTGYTREEVVGKNCRFLQGPKTEAETVAAIKDAVKRGSATTAKLLSYRKDGTTFWNLLHIAPVHDQAGRLFGFTSFLCSALIVFQIDQ